MLSEILQARARYEHAQTQALQARHDYEQTVRQAREAHTLKEIAGVLGVSPQRVLQIAKGK